MSGQAARAIIGQSTFTAQDPSVSQFTVGHAGGLAYANSMLFIADGTRVLPGDQQNHRVLIYTNVSNMFPAPKDSYPWNGTERCPLCGGGADIVLGQPNFATNDVGTGPSRMRSPTAVATDGRRLAVADTDNNRVLIWNSLPSATNQPADVVVGQSDFMSVGLNAGQGRQVNQSGLSGPQGVWIDFNGGLWVADTVNSRVLKWNTLPTRNGAPADLILGAPNFTTPIDDLSRGELPATASKMLNPVSVTVDPGGRLFVSDLGYNRVLVWNRLPSQNAEAANFALGQIDVATTPDKNAQRANNSPLLCRPDGIDGNGTLSYPGSVLQL